MTINNVTDLNDKSTEQWFKEAKIPIEVGNSVVPKGPKGAVTSADSDVVAMMATSKNKKEAAQFITFLASLKGQETLFDIYGALPTTLDGLKLSKVKKKIAAPFINSYKLGKGYFLKNQSGEVEIQLWNDLAKILNGEGTMADLKDNAKTKLNDLSL